MKSIHKTILLGVLLSTPSFADDAAVPVGSLSVNRNMVHQGVTPILTWNIVYPSGLDEIITIDPEDEEITTKTCLRVQVCMVGVGITDQRGTQYPAQSHLKFSSTGWQHIFTGKGRDVDPSRYYIDRVVSAGEKLSFKAKVDLNNYPFYSNNSRNVRVLKNGDLPPSAAAGYSHQTSAAEYLRPYIKDGKLSLGPLDVIYAAELTHSDPSHYGFDIQDSIVLVRFTKANCPVDGHGNSNGNNGHGNNADGIDSSNPGQGRANWGPDTDYDGDGVAEDDEAGGGGRNNGRNGGGRNYGGGYYGGYNGGGYYGYGYRG